MRWPGLYGERSGKLVQPGADSLSQADAQNLDWERDCAVERESCMPKPIKADSAGSGEVQGCFFRKQLAGEEGPSFETAKRLCELAAEFSAQGPWRFLEDCDLVLLEDPQSHEICYCSVMGALGEVYSLHVYVGAESYRFYRKLAAGEPITHGEFFASQRAVSVEFVMPSEMTPPDRECLRAIGHPVQRGIRIPVFRAFRPGYHPWYVAQHEAVLLIRCLQAVLTFCGTLPKGHGTAYWEEQDVYPFLFPTGSEEDRRDYEVKLVRTFEPPTVSPQIPHLSAAQLNETRARNFARGGVFEVDHFFSSAPVGNKNEHKACLRMGLVSDAASGIVFPPVLGKPEDSTGDILVAAVANAIQTAECLPREIHVQQSAFKIPLEPMATDLGFSIRLSKSMLALKMAKDHLLAMMGEPGPFTG